MIYPRILEIVQSIDIEIKSYQILKNTNHSAIYIVQTPVQEMVLKVNFHQEFQDFLRKEKEGLELIKATNQIATPELYNYKNTNQYECLLMEYIPKGTPNESSFLTFGQQLASLHSTEVQAFGGMSNNYIGDLVQINRVEESWSRFFIECRLYPQISLANQQGLMDSSRLPSIEDMISKVEKFLSSVQAAIIHGDLWSGNYIINPDGIPFLIDPSAYHGDPVVDIAMSKLFGGFKQSFYDAYFEGLPPSSFLNERIELYQLYYLLVHLNLFGKSYYPSVDRLIHKYFEN